MANQVSSDPRCCPDATLKTVGRLTPLRRAISSNDSLDSMRRRANSRRIASTFGEDKSGTGQTCQRYLASTVSPTILF